MTDNTYREPVTTDSNTSQSTPIENQTKDITQVPTNVEPPFTDYESKKGNPYPVDYFELGRYWNTGDLYTKEVETINTYLTHLVKTGEINNSTQAVSKKLKSIEKMINVDPEDRAASRVGRVAAYMEFLIKADNIKKDSAKYGMI